MGGGGGMGGGGEMGGGDMGGGGGFQAPKVTIRWDSSLPMREASLKLESKPVTNLPPRTHYVVSASGIPVMRQASNSAQLKERLIAVSFLSIKGKDPIPAERVEILANDKMMVFVFFFPKSQAISAGDKEVTFATRMGPMEIKGKFALKAMVFGGNLEL
jgi:hypothetical protein